MLTDQDVSQLLAVSYELGVLAGQERATKAQPSATHLTVLRNAFRSRGQRPDFLSAAEEAKLLALEDALSDESLMEALSNTPYPEVMMRTARAFGERRLRAYREGLAAKKVAL